MATGIVPHETSAAAGHRRRRELLADIEAYLRRTGTTHYSFGMVVENNPWTVFSLRNDYPQITERRAARVRAKMAAHPDGMKWRSAG